MELREKLRASLVRREWKELAALRSLRNKWLKNLVPQWGRPLGSQGVELRVTPVRPRVERLISLMRCQGELFVKLARHRRGWRRTWTPA